MKVLDLFSGLRGWSDPFLERGHEVCAIDSGEGFGPDICADILHLSPKSLPWIPDLILASPPCTAFSTMTMGKNWNYDRTPKTDVAKTGLALLTKTIALIEWLNPPLGWIIENPRAMMRKMVVLEGVERRTVTYCQYGESRMKPTDLFGGFPKGLILKPPCKNGAPCHVAAPRGSTTGTQGMESAKSAKIPRELAIAVCMAAEADIEQEETCHDCGRSDYHDGYCSLEGMI
jgi:hypothetical protein